MKETHKSIQEVFASILRKRGLTSRTEAEDFFTAPYVSTTDTWKLLPDIDKAVARIMSAEKSSEKIVIYGDYDVDGLTATALLLDVFSQLGIDATAYIPDRMKDGYGLNKKALERIADSGASLLITVDTGVSAVEEVTHANRLGLDVIITDHHEPKSKTPNAVAVVDPKCDKKCYQHYAGVGVAFELARALQAAFETKILPEQEKWLLDLVAIGTIADVVPLVGINRAFVKWGLVVAQQSKRKGIRHIIEELQVGASDSKEVSFKIAPLLNSAGRIANAQQALDLLTANTPADAKQYFKELKYINDRRRELQQLVIENAQDNRVVAAHVVVTVSESWHRGVVGIAAAKLADEHGKPAFVFAEDNGVLYGSARAPKHMSVFTPIAEVEGVIRRGGGHHAAVGLELDKSNLNAFVDILDSHYGNEPSVENNINADFLELGSLKLVNSDLADLVNQLQPFGNSNEQPIFKVCGAEVRMARLVGRKRNHLQLELHKDITIRAIYFNFPEEEIPTETVDVEFTIEPDSYFGGVQLHVNRLEKTK